MRMEYTYFVSYNLTNIKNSSYIVNSFVTIKLTNKITSMKKLEEINNKLKEEVNIVDEDKYILSISNIQLIKTKKYNITYSSRKPK